WLANKRPEIVASWIGRPDSSLLVAVDGDAILAVGSVTNAGEITLNYVAPQARQPCAPQGAGSAGPRARQHTMPTAQHRNRAPLLSFRWLCRYRCAGPQIRHELCLPDVETHRTGMTGRVGAIALQRIAVPAQSLVKSGRKKLSTGSARREF